jgi:hypothetical protein
MCVLLQGYLSHTLSVDHLLKVVAIECDEWTLSQGQDRAEKLAKRLKTEQKEQTVFVNYAVKSSDLNDLNATIKREVGTDEFCLIGLHTCKRKISQKKKMPL